MKKRFLSFLMSACMVLALLPVTALAAGTTITDIAVTMTEPQVGQVLPRDAKVTSPANVTVTAIRWYDGRKGEAPKSTKMEQGKNYVVYITVELAPGTDAKFGERYEVKATVNGQEATLDGNPTQSVTFWTIYYVEKPVEAPPPVAAPAAENYDTFDYRAYANIYPDLKAAYGYNAEKLYAHYVNYGKAEGRVGSFISGPNPKTNAPITAPKADGRFATLLDPLPPTVLSQQPDWSQNQCTPITEYSNVRLVAEYWFTEAYMDEAWEAEFINDAGGPESPKQMWLNDTVQIAVRGVAEELSARCGMLEDSPLTDFLREEQPELYKRTMASDTTILRQWSSKYAGLSTPLANPGTPGNPPVKSVGGFGDVLEDKFFAQPVVWAVEKGITGGTGAGRFSPYNSCTEGQIITFLWRAAGSPEPKTEKLTYIDKNAYYYKAVQWAEEQGMLPMAFQPEYICTRGEAVIFMWKYAGQPSAAPSGFTDVPDYYAKAVDWAVEQGVTGGTGNNQFSPNDNCTRGQIVTFLYRAFANR